MGIIIVSYKKSLKNPYNTIIERQLANVSKVFYVLQDDMLNMPYNQVKELVSSIIDLYFYYDDKKLLEFSFKYDF